MTSSHGGKRLHAGRLPGSGKYGEATRTLRIPESQVATVVTYLDTLRKPATAQSPLPVSSAPSTVSLRAFASLVPAGFPSPADDYLDDAIDLNKELIIHGHEEATFVLKVSGWSMVDCGIFDGDRVVVDRALEAQHDDVVVAVINNDLTIKKLGHVDGQLALLPENPHFKPIILAQEDTLEIWGVVTTSLRSFKKRRT